MARNTQKHRSPRPQGRLIGYARVSTDEQTTEAQEIELRAADCDLIVLEHGSGASRLRPALSKLLREISAGDTLIVVRLDRLARSVSHLLEVIEELAAKGAHFRSLRDPIDTSTPQGMFSLQVLGAVAQLERALISERTKAGIEAAKAKGRLSGNPGLRERRPEALAKMTAIQKAAYGARIQASAHQWLPTVRKMRPDHTWDDIARLLKQRGLNWTPERLRRAVKWLVSEHMADANLMSKSPPRIAEDRLMTLVAGIHSSNPNLTLREIASHLERLHERTPRGGSKWAPSSVKNLIDRARRTGLIESSKTDNSSGHF
ncbi:DNA invertase Pin-like site-specific DNA recombinase [Paenochrobactrum gallinarii]|uniref:DNA invertase Pin-like site-specific DNA recombinase n=1 Tax=Paenochrobactrum gallinarii TaxID=643673 RepID=A0A841M411_9HYPH|nr:recombinase family protein [Paenochrobactrum gallinarii]MBB6262509.1 DNA invertase Pin-like site-specific DNA recombinase [Paenochrobactrum gallinarii]